MTRLTRTTPAPNAGIVHLGLGAFSRAFIVPFVQEAMQIAGGDWGITGVSLKTSGTRDSLVPQGWVYTVVELAPDGRKPQVATAVADVLVAPEGPGAVLDALDRCRLVTLTVTEKGYCHTPSTGKLDLAHPDIQADLIDPDRPVSAVGFLVRGLARRRAAGRPAFTVLSCDNLPGNGHLLRGLVLDLARAIDLDLAAWIDAKGAFPCSMVDRIVPATTAADILEIERLTGYEDAAPVMCEPFRQWVIEDRFVNDERPALDRVGAELVRDVKPYEHMKLRMLNGTHSSLAYLGYLAGCETIADTVARPVFRDFVRHLWRAEIMPVMTPPPGIELGAYADTLLDRYGNPGIRHRTWQIAMDGSQKLPQRILGTLGDSLDAGRRPRGLMLALAAWMRYTSGQDLAGNPIDVRDPLAARFADHWATADPLSAYLATREVFPEALASDPRLRDGLADALALLGDKGAEGAARAIAEPPSAEG